MRMDKQETRQVACAVMRGGVGLEARVGKPSADCASEPSSQLTFTADQAKNAQHAFPPRPGLFGGGFPGLPLILVLGDLMHLPDIFALTGTVAIHAALLHLARIDVFLKHAEGCATGLDHVVLYLFLIMAGRTS